MQVSAGTRKDAVKEKVRGRRKLVPGSSPSIWFPRYGIDSCTGTCIYCTDTARMNTSARTIRRLALYPYSIEYYTQLVSYKARCTEYRQQGTSYTYKPTTKQSPHPHASCTQLPWFRFPFNFPALPWNFSARMVEWIELVDPGPRSNKLHSKRKIHHPYAPYVNNNISVSLPLRSLWPS